MEFSYEYTIIENTTNIPLNLEPLNFSTRWKETSKIDLPLDRIGKSVKCYLIRDLTFLMRYQGTLDEDKVL